MRLTGTGLVALALLLSSCGLVARDGSLIIHGRNESADAVGVRVDYAGSGVWGTLDDLSGGCSVVSLPWAISTGAAGPDGAVGDYHQLLSSANLADSNEAVIWIDVDKEGRVSWGEGILPWAGAGGPRGCAAGGQ